MPRRLRRPGRRGPARSRAPGRRAPARRRRRASISDHAADPRLRRASAPAVAWLASPSSTTSASRADRNMGQPHDAEPAHLQQPGQRRHRSGDAVLDIHAVISHQIEAAREQAQHQVGLARARWADQQHAVAGRGWRSSRGSAWPRNLGRYRAGREARLSPGGRSASVAHAMISRSDIAAAAARIARLCPAHASASPHRRGAGSRLSGDAEAGTAAARRQFQAARRVQSPAVGKLAGGRRDRRVGRQPWRGGRLCRARAGRRRRRSSFRR